MEADVAGLQRKVVSSRIRPARVSDGDSGLALKDGRTLPFVVTRSWSAPAGHYEEAWYLVDPSTREVLYQHSSGEVRVWGLQSWTDFTDTITDPIPLAPGSYSIVFALGGVQGGETTVSAAPALGSAA
jgi:hypothetical protein